MKEVIPKKDVLIEEIGLNLEERAGLAPLAARIYATTLLSFGNGLTFDEIIALTAACKSSVSSNINVLLQLGYLDYYTKIGDRKRYFKTTNNYVGSSIKQYESMLLKELDIVRKIKDFYQHNNSEKFNDTLLVGGLFQEYLEEQLNSIRLKINEIEQFQNQQ